MSVRSSGWAPMWAGVMMSTVVMSVRKIFCILFIMIASWVYYSESGYIPEIIYYCNGSSRLNFPARVGNEGGMRDGFCFLGCMILC